MTRIMLSITTSVYKDEQITNLSGASASAEVFERFFTEELPEEYRFTLISLKDKTADEISDMFDEIVKRYGPDTLRLRPNDPEALNLQTQTKRKRDDAKVAKTLQEGRDALKKGDFKLAASKAAEARRCARTIPTSRN